KWFFCSRSCIAPFEGCFSVPEVAFRFQKSPVTFQKSPVALRKWFFHSRSCFSLPKVAFPFQRAYKARLVPQLTRWGWLVFQWFADLHDTPGAMPSVNGWMPSIDLRMEPLEPSTVSR